MVTITHIDTACMLIDINGFRIMTDPTLDKAGHLYYHGAGVFSRKTDNPSLPPTGLQPVDLVLLSHHQHMDNFDHKGREFALSVPLILSTKPAAKAIRGITGLEDWESFSINTAKVPGLKITATPAQHHPWWVPGFIAGKVIGFIIEFDSQEDGVIYISGDTVYFKGIEEVGKRFKIDTAIFHLGAVQVRYLTGGGEYTMNGKDLLKSIQRLNPNKVIPVHYRGWTHFKESEATLKQILAGDPPINRKVSFLLPGVPTTI